MSTVTASVTASAGLACRDATVRFGSFTAVDAVSIDFTPGLLHGIIGPNGAGKTTLINALSGRQQLTSGQVLLDGQDISQLPAHARARLGIARSFQITKIFPTMTVLENLRLAGQASRLKVQPFWRPVRSYPALTAAAQEMLGFIGLGDQRNVVAEQLSHGDQRALEVGLTLMTQPRIVLLDEPMAGVGRHEIDRAVNLITRIRKGRTVVLIEHNMDVMMALADRIVVMTHGAVLATDTPERVRSNSAVRSAYLGEESDALA